MCHPCETGRDYDQIIYRLSSDSGKDGVWCTQTWLQGLSTLLTDWQIERPAIQWVVHNGQANQTLNPRATSYTQLPTPTHTYQSARLSVWPTYAQTPFLPTYVIQVPLSNALQYIHPGSQPHRLLQHLNQPPYLFHQPTHFSIHQPTNQPPTATPHIHVPSFPHKWLTALLTKTLKIETKSLSKSTNCFATDFSPWLHGCCITRLTSLTHSLTTSANCFNCLASPAISVLRE